jgi:hypothetical protein
MWCTIYESIIVGIITLIIGNIIFNLSINKQQNKELDKNEIKPYGINLAFFMTGLILHIILELLGFNRWYCDKKDKCSNITYYNL